MAKDASLPGWNAPLEVYDETGSSSESDSEDEHDDHGYNFTGASPESVFEHVFDWSRDWICVRRTLLENAMLDVMNEITDKEDWRDKIKDEAIRARWQDEIKSQLRPVVVASSSPHHCEEVPDRAADFCLEELEYKAEHETCYSTVLGIGTADIVKFDTVPEQLTHRLGEIIARLAATQTEINLQPNDKKIRHLIHPSLSPLVFGHTKIRADMAGESDNIPVPSPAKYYSIRFQWLPSEWSGKFASPVYGSTLELDDALSELVKVCIPLWERCIATTQGRTAWRVHGKEDSAWEDVKVDRLLTVPHEFAYSYPDYDEEFDSQSECDDYHEADADERKQRKWWQACRIPLCPFPGTFSEFVTKTQHHPYNLPDNLQIIVKISEMHLTPEDSKYDGGSWHVEGLANEHICATAIFYYDVDNIESSISFDSGAISQDLEPGQGDYDGLNRIYGTDFGSGVCEQSLPTIRTRQGRILAFPNVFRHCVEPFELTDKSRPGHRKMIVLWLVNPDKRIISTAHVQPLERSREQVLADQLELMKERSRNGPEYSNHRRHYLFCEH